jgi:hypothetical protein
LQLRRVANRLRLHEQQVKLMPVTTLRDFVERIREASFVSDRPLTLGG